MSPRRTRPRRASPRTTSDWSSRLLDHITIRVSDREAAERFYDTVLRTIGVELSGRDDDYTVWKGQFSLAAADAGHPVTRHLHIGFAAPSRGHVDELWRVGTAEGYRDDGAPGPRPEYSDDYYGAFLLDPDGNSAEGVHHGGTAKRDSIDHLWIGVADLAAARRFYEQAAPFTGFELKNVLPERVHFGGGNASFGVVERTPTQNLHIGFETQHNATVDAFHRTLTRAGYTDNGAPGERHYHPGYYGAFVLDPDGNNVEVVNHNRA
jgi:catechol 2,3-dioxygenase-like lactoylglutathione lyase family enzyme